jgi:hypothetical protein
VLTDVEHEAGFCFRAAVDPLLPSDEAGISRLQVYENGVPLPAAHADHDTIRREGRGAFSHWGPWVYFSTTDRSDPRMNRRTYASKEV